METWTEEFNCPECNTLHDVDFDFWSPDDGDKKRVTVECGCGCEFDVECKIMIEYDFEITQEPEVTKPGPVPFDINDVSTWPPENDPNQLKLIE